MLSKAIPAILYLYKPSYCGESHNSYPMPKHNADLIRKRLLELRENLSVAQCQRGSLLMRARLFTWLGLAIEQVKQQGLTRPLVVAAFWSLPNEPALEPLLHQWDEAGIVVALPVMVQKEGPLAFYRWTPDTEMVPAKFGVFEPKHDDAALPGHENAASTPYQGKLVPDIVLVPSLGYTKFADRLGYGKGFYDRTLHALRKSGKDPVTIGLSWDEGAIEAEFPEYEAQAHDEQLDAILTPTGWVPGPPEITDNFFAS